MKSTEEFIRVFKDVVGKSSFGPVNSIGIFYKGFEIRDVYRATGYCKMVFKNGQLFSRMYLSSEKAARNVIDTYLKSRKIYA